jgi:cyclophilin family peptidyl-prolyl cis-trans isomerase
MRPQYPGLSLVPNREQDIRIYIFMRLKATLVICLLLAFTTYLSLAQSTVRLKNKDRKKDVELITAEGTIILRLSDSTPLHRDNFLKLVKDHFYDGILFHRVIQNFMIQAGDPKSRNAIAGQALGDSDLPYTIPAEFRVTLFHQRGVLAAAREGDSSNPQKASSSTQFYIVQGKIYNDSQLDSVELYKLKRKIPGYQRQVYKTLGGVPRLDQNYTIFGEVVSGMEVVNKIAAVPTSKGNDRDRPLNDVRIISAKLIKRKSYSS